MKKRKTLLVLIGILLVLPFAGREVRATSNETEIGYTTSTTASIPSGNPNTGDSSEEGTYLIMIGLSMMALIGIAAMKKKEEDV